jgi:hypothetical protein
VDFPVYVEYMTLDGTALAGVDYTMTSGVMYLGKTHCEPCAHAFVHARILIRVSIHACIDECRHIRVPQTLCGVHTQCTLSVLWMHEQLQTWTEPTDASIYMCFASVAFQAINRTAPTQLQQGSTNCAQ